jgi:putative hydrolase of the HAD superfamily
MTRSSPIEAVLFDLGGVVLEIDFARALAHWQAHSGLPPPRLQETFGVDEPYRQHETGAIGAAEYFAHLRDRLQLRCGHEAILEGWNAIFAGEIDDTLRLIDALPPAVRRYALSNTNAAHLAHMQRAHAGVLARFERVFVSHEIGHRKPHRQAFAHVVRAIGVAPAHILFFDDLPENVQAAHDAGLHAVQVRSPADVRAGLQRFGFLRAS